MITVVEIKTVNGFFYDGLVKGKFAPYWNKQLSYYADAASAAFNEPVQAVTLLVDRNFGKLAVQPLSYDGTWKAEVEELRGYYETLSVPPREEDKCDKCELKKACKLFKDPTISELINAVSEMGICGIDGEDEDAE